jgi:hypothetical protein
LQTLQFLYQFSVFWMHIRGLSRFSWQLLKQYLYCSCVAQMHTAMPGRCFIQLVLLIQRYLLKNLMHSTIVYRFSKHFLSCNRDYFFFIYHIYQILQIMIMILYQILLRCFAWIALYSFRRVQWLDVYRICAKIAKVIPFLLFCWAPNYFNFNLLIYII